MSSAWEGMPIALIEATLVGLPSVLTNVGGCAELLHETCSGLVVDDMSPEAYATALRRIVNDTELRESMAANARKYAGRYELETAVRAHVDLYHEIIDRPC